MQILGLKWDVIIKTKTYIELSKTKANILNYLNVVDTDLFERKLNIWIRRQRYFFIVKLKFIILITVRVHLTI